jgi:hypothetical protein
MNLPFRESALVPVAGEAKPPNDTFEQITAQAESNDNAEQSHANEEEGGNFVADRGECQGLQVHEFILRKQKS